MEEPKAPEPNGDEAVDVLLAEFNGDARAAIKALLHDVDVLDFNSCVSVGFVRKRIVLRAGLPKMD